MKATSLAVSLALFALQLSGYSVEASETPFRRALANPLNAVCQSMWTAAGNNMAIGTDLTVNTATAPLMTLTASSQAKLGNAVYTSFVDLLDNYSPPLPTPRQKLLEETAFIDNIAVPGGPVEIAFNYLKANGLTTAPNLNAFKAVLSQMWFVTYPYSYGGSPIQHSGFEHVFVGENVLNAARNPEVKGFHNWYQFYLEHAAGKLVYTPPPTRFVNKSPYLVHVSFTWNGDPKIGGSSFYVGTSPAFEIALYTLCFFAKPHPQVCTCNINGQPLEVKAIQYQTSGHVLTAYPQQ